MGWSDLDNGNLLHAAKEEFDVVHYDGSELAISTEPHGKTIGHLSVANHKLAHNQEPPWQHPEGAW
jgi:hypothetical protein